MSSEPQVKYARTSDGVNIAWYAIGDGLPYVFPANVPSNVVDQWRTPELRETLEVYVSRGATLVSYDSRGFGLSDRGLMDHSCEAMVRDLEAVVDAAGLDRFVLQSFSYMSVPVLAYAALHPERVIALVLMNGVMRGSDLHDSWERLVRIAADDWEEATLMLARRNEAGWASTISSLEQAREMLDRASTQEEFLAFCKALAGWDVSDQLESVTHPSLVLHFSGLPSFIPLEASRRLAASLPKRDVRHR